MKSLLEHIMTLISSLVVFGLALMWYLDKPANTPMILMITSGTVVLITIFFRFTEPKHPPSQKPTNTIKSKGQQPTVVNENSGKVVINNSTNDMVIDGGGTYNNYINSSKNTTITNNITNVFHERVTYSLRNRVDVLLKQVDKNSTESIDLKNEIARLTAIIDKREKLSKQIIEKYKGQTSFNKSPTYQLALELMLNGEMEKALEFLTEAELEREEHRVLSEKRKNAESRLLKADILLVKEDMEGAEYNYKKSVSIHRFCSNLKALGDFYYRSNQHLKAIDYYLHAKEVAETMEEQIAVSNNLGSSYFRIGEVSASENQFDDSIKLLRSISSPNQKELITLSSLLNNYAGLLEKTERFQESEDNYNEALDILSSLPNQFDNEVLREKARVHHNHGNLKMLINDLTNAFLHYEKALVFRRGLFQKENYEYSFELAETLNSLACLRRDQFQWDKSIKLFEEALKIRNELVKKRPGWNRHYVLMTLFQLAKLHLVTENFVEAKKISNEAVTGWRDITLTEETDFASLADCLSAFGMACLRIGDLACSLNSFLEAKAIFLNKVKRDLPTHKHGLLLSQNDLGIYYLETHAYEKSEEEFREAILAGRYLVMMNQKRYESSLGMCLINQSSLFDNWPGRAVDLDALLESLNYLIPYEENPTIRKKLHLAFDLLEKNGVDISTLLARK